MFWILSSPQKNHLDISWCWVPRNFSSKSWSWSWSDTDNYICNNCHHSALSTAVPVRGCQVRECEARATFKKLGLHSFSYFVSKYLSRLRVQPSQPWWGDPRWEAKTGGGGTLCLQSGDGEGQCGHCGQWLWSCQPPVRWGGRDSHLQTKVRVSNII